MYGLYGRIRTNFPKAYIHTFRKQLSFIWRCVFVVSIFKFKFSRFFVVPQKVSWRPLKEQRNYKRNYFCVRHRNRWKHNQHSKMLFFKTNLHFVTSNHISTYRKLNLLLASSAYLVFLPLEMQRRLQSIPQVLLICLKRNDPTTFKSSSC